MEHFVYISPNIKTYEGFMENMEAELDAAEKHGIVFGQQIEDRESLKKTARKYLPPYTITESVNTDCYIVKQAVIDLFGAPDEACRNSQAELMRYYEKINKYGYSAIIAHHALYTAPEKTPTSEGIDNETNPVLPFLPLLDDEYYVKKRILFECTNLPATHCGTTEVMLCAYRAFLKLYKDKYDIYMLTNREASAYHKLEEKYGNILYPDTIKETYHLGYVPVQMHQYESQLLLDKHCLKIAQQVLDIIMVRSYRYHDLAARANIDLGIRYSDGITFISNFSKADFMAYYTDERYADKIYRTIYVTKEITEAVNGEHGLPFEDFILIAGNTFKHKIINETLDIAQKTKHKYIVVGSRKTGKISSNIYGYRSGQLSEELMDTLYSSCKAILFPSVYEGFGLPIIMAIRNNKKIIVYDNQLNRELHNHFADFKDNFVFFNTFEKMFEILSDEQNVIDNTDDKIKNNIGSWDSVATQLETFFEEILAQETDINKLNERIWTYKHINEKSALRQFGDYKMTQLLRFSIKENIKHRHPALFKMLKRLKGAT